jgi:type III secretory pathway component EscT
MLFGWRINKKEVVIGLVMGRVASVELVIVDALGDLTSLALAGLMLHLNVCMRNKDNSDFSVFAKHTQK